MCTVHRASYAAPFGWIEHPSLYGIHSSDLLPNHRAGVLHAQPGRQHPAVGPAHGDDGAAAGAWPRALQLPDQHREVGQGLLRAQVVQVLAVLWGRDGGTEGQSWIM